MADPKIKIIKNKQYNSARGFLSTVTMIILAK